MIQATRSICAAGASEEELAAIAIALARSPHPELVEGNVSQARASSDWALAARYPEAEFDELRAIVCSTR